MGVQISKTCLTILLAGEILAAPAAFGNAIRFNFGTGGNPAVTALFQDAGPNQVNLTISATPFAGGNSLTALFFNLNPVFDSGNLVITQTGSIGGVQGVASVANDSKKVSGGGGKFDIKLLFGDSPGFIAGDSATYSISGISGFSVNDFLFKNTLAAGRISTYASGSLRDSSGFVIIDGTPEAVPDVASTAGLFLLGLLALGVVARPVVRRGIPR